MTNLAGPVAFAAGPALSFLPAMSKARNVLGIVTGGILILTSAAHSFLGWKSMRAQLVAIGAPNDLIIGLGAGWILAGLAICVFGVLLLMTFIPRAKGMYKPLTVARIIGYAYGGFGVVAYGISKDRYFLSIFAVPGILTLIASSEKDEE